MTRGLILAANGFSGPQLEYAYHRLREDAVLVDVASPDGSAVLSDRGTDWESIPVTELDPGRRYDLVVIPGGDGPETLVQDSATRRWVAEYVDAGGIVCAIAEGVRLLSATGVLDGRLSTASQSGRGELESAGAIPTEEAVTVDGTIVTTRDTEALPFGIAAGLGCVAIPQDPATDAVERPRWGEPDTA